MNKSAFRATIDFHIARLQRRGMDDARISHGGEEVHFFGLKQGKMDYSSILIS